MRRPPNAVVGNLHRTAGDSTSIVAQSDKGKSALLVAEDSNCTEVLQTRSHDLCGLPYDAVHSAVVTLPTVRAATMRRFQLKMLKKLGLKMSKWRLTTRRTSRLISFLPSVSLRSAVIFGIYGSVYPYGNCNNNTDPS